METTLNVAVKVAIYPMRMVQNVSNKIIFKITVPVRLILILLNGILYVSLIAIIIQDVENK